MDRGTPRLPGFFPMMVLLLCALAGAQTKPPESTSKVKSVLLYNKIGGWVHADGIQDVRTAMAKIAAAKGFTLVQSFNDTDLTPEFLRQFQVIVWNNNTNGGASVPSLQARQAVLDYVNGGGGWLLLHGASWSPESWPGLHSLLGTRFSLHASNDGPLDAVTDPEAELHKELKWMVKGYPKSLRFTQTWDNYANSVRGLPGMVVVATLKAIPGGTPAVAPIGAMRDDWPLSWARAVGRGRMIFNGLGHGQYDLMAQNDSVLPRIYWENLRYAAGDYQNGCTHPENLKFDPDARIDDGSECMIPARTAAPAAAPPGLTLSHGGRRIRFGAPLAAPMRFRLRDFRGTLVRERTLPAGAGELALDGAVPPGVYHLEMAGASGTYRRRLALP